MRGQVRVNCRHAGAHAACLCGKEDGNPGDKKVCVQLKLKAISSDLWTGERSDEPHTRSDPQVQVWIRSFGRRFHCISKGEPVEEIAVWISVCFSDLTEAFRDKTLHRKSVVFLAITKLTSKIRWCRKLRVDNVTLVGTAQVARDARPMFLF
jgi:hypothetical protein